MPLYVRECKRCGYAAEGLEQITAKEVIECPSCRETFFAKKPSISHFEIRGASYRSGYE